MSVFVYQINNSRLFIGGVVDYTAQWKEIRICIENIKTHMLNIEEKWEVFTTMTPLLVAGSMALMGSYSKDDKVPDETITRPNPSVTPGKVFTLNRKAQSLGIDLNPEKFYVPVTVGNDKIYSEEMNASIDNWVAIADLYLKITDCLYKIGTCRGFNSTFLGMGDQNTTLRTPGQVTLNYPVSNAILVENNDHPALNRKRMWDRLEDEYFYWNNRPVLEMITDDPVLYRVDAERILDGNVTEADVTQNYEGNDSSDPRMAKRYTFSLENSEDTLLGLNFAKASHLGEEFKLFNGATTAEHEWIYPEESVNHNKVTLTIQPPPGFVAWSPDPEWEPPAEDPNAEEINPNAGLLSEDYSLTNILVVAVKLHTI